MCTAIVRKSILFTLTYCSNVTQHCAPMLCLQCNLSIQCFDAVFGDRKRIRPVETSVEMLVVVI